MKKISILLAVILASTVSVAFAKTKKLSVSSPKTVNYQCNNDSKVTASYYKISDNSLSFVKLTLKGEAYTLPNLVSASGARYSDMNKIEWWEKNGKVTLDEEVTDDKSKLVECKEITTRQNK
jgi:membrane-bound inhibitor of C-type lysozyme